MLYLKVGRIPWRLWGSGIPPNGSICTRGLAKRTYVVVLTDRFSRRADTHAAIVAEFTAEGTVDVLIKKYNPLWIYVHAL